MFTLLCFSQLMFEPTFLTIWPRFLFLIFFQAHSHWAPCLRGIYPPQVRVHLFIPVRFFFSKHISKCLIGLKILIWAYLLQMPVRQHLRKNSWIYLFYNNIEGLQTGSMSPIQYLYVVGHNHDLFDTLAFLYYGAHMLTSLCWRNEQCFLVNCC